MTQKTIMIGLVAIAFVAGSIMTGTMASAEKGGIGDNLIIDALNGIAAAITGIDPNVTVEPTPVDIVVNAPQGEQGIQGIQGIQGVQGNTGIPGTFKTYSVVETANDPTIVEATAQCDLGDFATGGAGEAGNSGNELVQTFPVDSTGGSVSDGEITTGWKTVVQIGTNPNSAEAIATVICLDNMPFRDSLPPIVVIP